MDTLQTRLEKNQRSLQRSLKLAFGVALACTAVLALLSLRILGASIQSDRSVERSYQVKTALHRLSTHLDDMQNHARGFLISEDPIYVAPLQEALQAVPLDLKELNELLDHDSPQWADYQAIIPNVEYFLTSAAKSPENRRKMGFTKAVEQFKLNRGIRRMNEIRGHLDSIGREEEKRLTVRLSRRNEEYVQLQRLISILAVLAILFLTVSGWRILKDLDDRKRAQRLLVEKSKMAALGEMASGIAHEINNPLGIIRGKAQILRMLTERSTLDTEKVVEASLKIEDTVVRIDKIVTGLLSFVHGGREKNTELVRVNQLIELTLELCRARFAKYNIDLRVMQTSESAEIRCRPVELSQVLLNLLNNAFDAVQQRPADPPWVEIRVQDEPKNLTIAVLDSGPGVPYEFRDKIMLPFFSTKEAGKGTGLGLSVSKGIVESYGGVLRLREGLEHTCFEMSLPK